MKKLQILMPMGGLGSRFANAGYSTPKPLIDVDGMPMFQKAISSLQSLNIPKDFYFVIRQEHVDEQRLDSLILETLPEAQVIVIPKLTRGAAETALAAKEKLDKNSPLVIMDCDLWFKSTTYEQMVKESYRKKSDIHGGLLTFESNSPRYSYAEVDQEDNVLRTAEKKVISSHAITGAYFFSSARTFIDAAENLLALPLSEAMPEYYLSLIYNLLIESGKKVKATYINEFASFGTPEELNQYESTH